MPEYTIIINNRHYDRLKRAYPNSHIVYNGPTYSQYRFTTSDQVPCITHAPWYGRLIGRIGETFVYAYNPDAPPTFYVAFASVQGGWYPQIEVRSGGLSRTELMLAMHNAKFLEEVIRRVERGD